MICRVCGEEKDEKQFYKLKHFHRDKKEKKFWCKDCMRMWIELETENKRKKEFQEKIGPFKLEFN